MENFTSIHIVGTVGAGYSEPAYWNPSERRWDCERFHMDASAWEYSEPLYVAPHTPENIAKWRAMAEADLEEATTDPDVRDVRVEVTEIEVEE
jgi:hypothetical protein